MDLEARVKELATLNAIGDILNRETSFDAAIKPALERLINLVNLSTGWVFLTNVEQGDAHEGSLHLSAYSGLPAALESDGVAPLRCGSCECWRLLREGKLDTGVTMVRCSRLRDVQGERGGLRVHASIPLLGQQGPVGIMNLASPGTTHFDKALLSFLTAVGRQLGTAFERSRLQVERTREVRYLATLEERHRLAQEMHDSVAQLLFAADLSLSVAKDTQDSALQRHSVARAHEVVQSALAELRALVEVMRPADLSCGLKAALIRLSQRVSSSIVTHVDAQDVTAADEVEDALYRIAQEAFHNTLRHAQATHVWVRLTQTTNGLTLVIEDDGVGLAKQTETGLGIESMRDRALNLAGTFFIGKSERGGCKVEVTLP